MKLAPIAVFMFRDTDEGFAAAIPEALHPNPSSFSRLDDSFDLSLDHYGIKDLKASGKLLHYVDNQGVYKVSLVIMQHYEPPVLACALNEVLKNIIGDYSSLMPTLLVPFLVDSSKVKGQSKSLRSHESKTSIFGIQIGQNTDMQALLKRTQEPPSSLQIQHETFACFLHFVRVMQLPAFFLIGQTSHEAIHEIGEILASSTGLQFSKDRMIWNPKKTVKESKEPWRDLYG